MVAAGLTGAPGAVERERRLARARPARPVALPTTDQVLTYPTSTQEPTMVKPALKANGR